jgi:hypothetical protein
MEASYNISKCFVKANTELYMIICFSHGSHHHRFASDTFRGLDSTEDDQIPKSSWHEEQRETWTRDDVSIIIGHESSARVLLTYSKSTDHDRQSS